MLPGRFLMLRQILNDFLNCVPNRIVAVILATGIAGELILLSRVEQPLLEMGFPMAVMTVSFLLWFWLTVGLVFHKAARAFLRWRDRVGATKQIASTICIGGFLLAVVVLYAISWGLYLQTSRFASWEVARFTFVNGRDLWLYLKEAEPIHFLYGGLLAALVGAAFAMLLRPISHAHHTKSELPVFFNALWILSVLFLLFGIQCVNRDMNYNRRLTNLASLSSSMNPCVAFCSSFAESISGEPIEPVLDESELVSLDTPWSPEFADGRHKPSIIFVQIESLRSDVIHQKHQGQEITPNINRLANRGLNWTNAYSQATHSDYADPCVVSSLYPLRQRTHHYYSKNDPWPKTLSYDCLKPAGYATAIISSQNEMWGRMEHFLDSPNLDLFYHPERSSEAHLASQSVKDKAFFWEVHTGNLKAGKFPDSHTANQAIAWIHQQVQIGRPFLLNMNLQSSHFPYTLADDTERPFQPCQLAANDNFMKFPKEHIEIVRNAYFNSLHEADRQVGRLVETLTQLDMIDDVIFVVVGENGEAFHENNTVGHAREPYEPAIHVATVMFGPRYFEPGTEEYPLEHVDLLPTLFGRIGLAAHPNFQGIDALAGDRPPLEERMLFCHVISPASTADSLQWGGRWKYMWDHLRKRASLYDLENDPGEQNNLAEDLPKLSATLHQHLTRWRDRQLSYYHFPNYYRRFYPPKPPHIPADKLESIRKYLQRS
jgi:arylsulfatase A-like enzyme